MIKEPMAPEDIADEDMQKLKAAVKRSFDGVGSSAYFLALYTENYQKDPVALIQLALGILMDKPILLLVPYDVVLPARLEKIADAVARYHRGDAESAATATRELLHRVIKQ